MATTELRHPPPPGVRIDPARAAKAAEALRRYEGDERPFPSLLVRAGALVPQGSFAERQAEYLSPAPAQVDALRAALAEKRIGIVAHFYMDASIQGLLTALESTNVFIADSLAMGDAAVHMAQAGVQHLLCLGVDFMSENCRAVLDMNGFQHVPVYRLAAEQIGCSLATAAEQPGYSEWLEAAKKAGNAAHVVYINTSLLTKAKAHNIVPTITCTSSNVVDTILQIAVQAPEANIFYGPDSYMGRNLRTLFEHLASLPDEEVKKIHPQHTAATVKALLERFNFYERGYCLVHHMFGYEVVRRIRKSYITGSPDDAFCTAHLEVPGEMFELAVRQQREGKGVVGSTSNILDFITKKTHEAVDNSAVPSQRLRFILGTEAGMTTSIVRKVQDILRTRPERDVAVEIIFPVSSQAIAPAADMPELGIVPGVCGGEGCSLAGGCASCPFMKMNTLAGMLDVVAKIDSDDPAACAWLARLQPRVYTERVGGKTAAELGTVPIRYMREFQRTHRLPDAFVAATVAK
eukprot:TRINITY_DN4632_c0_g1_i1.p1 TRINITY_DN4632_c0_g1~~TRINITY_DN4632_c0_g1_i1.p1  ORF type:complete len:533 (-),score=147.22 TRINITY_DN4632_c0_g1_i1:90-1649(-)